VQPSDTAYPRFKSRLSQTELVESYTPSDTELMFCNSMTRSTSTRLGFVLLLKTYQRLGYFVSSKQVPNVIIEHIATAIGEPNDWVILEQYDSSQARRKHLSAVRNFLNVKPFGNDGKVLIRQTFSEAALTKEDVIDIVNIGIETLVRQRSTPWFGKRVPNGFRQIRHFLQKFMLHLQMRGEPLSTRSLLSAMIRVGLAPGTI
jgi:hypothetical protein